MLEAQSNSGPITAIIFDMDGLLIDSEPLWQEAEMRVFRHVGITLSRSDCMQTMGRRVDEVVEHWYQRHPWNGLSKADVSAQIVDELISLVHERGEAKEGLQHIFSFFSERKMRLALASSSYQKIITAITTKLGIADLLEVTHSAECEVLGKPHPAVYLSTAKLLGVQPSQCLAFEDSINGVQSAKRAGMRCVFIPEPGTGEVDTEFPPDLQLGSLLQFGEQELQRLSSGISKSRS